MSMTRSTYSEKLRDAIDELRSSGELERLTQRWMSQAAGAPLLR